MIEKKDVQLGKRYWVVDESAPIGKEVFQYQFVYSDEWIERWDWTVFEIESEAHEYASTLSR